MMSKNMEHKILESINALGRQYYRNKNFNLCGKAFRYLCTNDPDNPHYLTALGASEYQKGEYISAQQLFEKAIRKNSTLSDPYINLAMTYMAQEKKETARNTLEHALNLMGRNQKHTKAIAKIRSLLMKAGTKKSQHISADKDAT